MFANVPRRWVFLIYNLFYMEIFWCSTDKTGDQAIKYLCRIALD